MLERSLYLAEPADKGSITITHDQLVIQDDHAHEVTFPAAAASEVVSDIVVAILANSPACYSHDRADTLAEDAVVDAASALFTALETIAPAPTSPLPSRA